MPATTAGGSPAACARATPGRSGNVQSSAPAAIHGDLTRAG
jgi:hypothetical protein